MLLEREHILQSTLILRETQKPDKLPGNMWDFTLVLLEAEVEGSLWFQVKKAGSFSCQKKAGIFSDNLEEEDSITGTGKSEFDSSIKVTEITNFFYQYFIYLTNTYK